MSEMVALVAKAMAEELDDLDVRGLHVAARSAIAAMYKALEDYDVEDWPAVFDKCLK